MGALVIHWVRLEFDHISIFLRSCEDLSTSSLKVYMSLKDNQEAIKCAWVSCHIRLDS